MHDQAKAVHFKLVDHEGNDAKIGLQESIKIRWAVADACRALEIDMLCIRNSEFRQLKQVMEDHSTEAYRVELVPGTYTVRDSN